MRIRNLSSSRMLLELLSGVIIYTIIGEALIIYFSSDKLYDTIGFVVGALFASALIVHMAFSIEKAIVMDEHGALKKTRLSFTIRIVAVIVIFAILIAFRLGNPILAVFGLFAMKVAAYIQPITHKLYNKF